ncbi:NAD(P)-dependent oxidoreductase [Pseudomonas nitroreducens]|uniref:NAD-dependent epimerase/dehydratase family protein n=1 Tax=Pseudomonas nitroreducens TaxID=46680 RepID=UPI001472A403|nr:NAD(P)-dependent oxidoreductase [Pseudomonas nitroreducens]MDG9857163.1 NAD(P)-dependent oxidoreductase [Pseudomonas nitroreducens]MDH1074298.1 NAD(P)-dependent oxidoreductase [Pseudomonas nitroreducens]NMZ72912.1 NAD(P)-dependent oxidoreductase [Pseudomonas nitroreducens]
MRCAVIFGGSGFIGVFFAKKLLSTGKFEKVYLFDKEQVSDKRFSYRKELVRAETRIVEIRGDVRQPIEWTPPESISLIANFAAVHREPGHEDFEYYETNLLGAQHVCAWAERVGCNEIIFTSSISPYGPSEEQKDERSLPVPMTAYGGSKLVAEKMHQTWLAADKENRHLVIVRPGVVFGPGEGGNVSRLVKAVMRRYFFYMGNRETRKAGTYVKELCSAIWWMLERQKTEGERLSLFNMSMNPGPSIQEYVDTVCQVAGVTRRVPAIPFPLLLCAAYGIDLVARPLGIRHPFSPVRIRKLVRSNNIHPGRLVELGYPYQYDLKSAFSDWKSAAPEEWR